MEEHNAPSTEIGRGTLAIEPKAEKVFDALAEMDRKLDALKEKARTIFDDVPVAALLRSLDTIEDRAKRIKAMLGEVEAPGAPRPAESQAITPEAARAPSQMPSEEDLARMSRTVMQDHNTERLLEEVTEIKGLVQAMAEREGGG